MFFAANFAAVVSVYFIPILLMLLLSLLLLLLVMISSCYRHSYCVDVFVAVVC